MTAVEPRVAASVAAFVRGSPLAVVATTDPRQRPEAALVGIAALDDGTLIFDTRRDARKVTNLQHNPCVAVVVSHDDGVSLQIEGIAQITAGADREAYGNAYNAEFPGSRALDDEFAVVVVRPTWVRVYDTTTQPPLVAEAHWPDPGQSATR
jgi:general stress protein 26